MRNIKEILLFALGCAFTSICFLLFQNHNLKTELIEVEKPVVKTEAKIITKTDTIYNILHKRLSERTRLKPIQPLITFRGNIIPISTRTRLQGK